MKSPYRRSRNEGPILPTSHANRHAHPKEEGVMSHAMRGHFVAMTGEFVGTFLFLFFALSGTQIANTIAPVTTDASTIFYIALSFGFSLMVSVWVFYRISGGLFNPAVCNYLLRHERIHPDMRMNIHLGQVS